MKWNRIIVAIIGFLALSFAAQAQAQHQTFLWPIAGKTAGADILSRPQNYIGDELNGDDLFIGAEPGALVLCPADGIITSVGPTYQRSMVYMLGARCQETMSLTENVLATESSRPGRNSPGAIPWAWWIILTKLSRTRHCWSPFRPQAVSRPIP